VKTFFLWFVDVITRKSCVLVETSNFTLFTYNFDENKCNNANSTKECTSSGGTCRIDIDGYYIEVILNVVYGIFWYRFAKNFVKNLETIPINDWHVLSKVRTTQHSEDATREVSPLSDKEDEL
jgi:MFS transporter, PAT family, solute carrier family 33 (acetyl-CoA transportor), member 1